MPAQGDEHRTVEDQNLQRRSEYSADDSVKPTAGDAIN